MKTQVLLGIVIGMLLSLSFSPLSADGPSILDRILSLEQTKADKNHTHPFQEHTHPEIAQLQKAVAELRQETAALRQENAALKGQIANAQNTANDAVNRANNAQRVLDSEIKVNPQFAPNKDLKHSHGVLMNGGPDAGVPGKGFNYRYQLYLCNNGIVYRLLQTHDGDFNWRTIESIPLHH